MLDKDIDNHIENLYVLGKSLEGMGFKNAALAVAQTMDDVAYNHTMLLSKFIPYICERLYEDEENL